MGGSRENAVCDDERCNRFQSCEQITDTSDNTVEAGPPRTCASSLKGVLRWGPATDQRFPLIDEERGTVFGRHRLLPGKKQWMTNKDVDTLENLFSD